LEARQQRATEADAIAMIEALLDRDPSSPAIRNIQRYYERGPEALGAVTGLLAAWLIRAWT
jgi:hypothetical protein